MPVSPDQFWLAVVGFFRQELDRRLASADISYCADPAYVRIEIPTKLGTSDLVVQASRTVAAEFMKAGWEDVWTEVSLEKVTFGLRASPDSMRKGAAPEA